MFPVINYAIKVYPHDENFPHKFKENGLSPLFLDNFRETMMQNFFFLLIYFIIKFILPKISRKSKKLIKNFNNCIIRFFLKGIIKACKII